MVLGDMATFSILSGIIGTIVTVVLYVYFALVFSTIARKLEYKNHWLAWIPVANLFLLPILAKKKWPWGFIFLVPVVNAVFMYIWLWSIYKQRKYPGWLSLVTILSFIPIVNIIVMIAHIVIVGMVAWADRK